MNELWRQLKQKWTSEKVELGTPATALEIEQFEQTHHVVVPDDFRSYLLHVNGMGNGDYQIDDHCLYFWPLSTIKSVAHHGYTTQSEDDGKQLFLFADFLISSHEFVIRLTAEKSNATPVYFFYGESEQIAPNFTEFITRYMADDEAVIYPAQRSS